jgi:iron complex outermembrane receptor protein
MAYFKMRPIALSVSIVFCSSSLFANEVNQQQQGLNHDVARCHDAHSSDLKRCEFAPIVITATAPQAAQAFHIQADPKQPIQPVPASDGADYLKNVAGFNAIRNGGTNGDPVFRGMFGSRLKILNNGTEMLGACPVRMDAPTSYIAPSNFDEIDIVKGPQTVLWGAATVNFKREQPNFDDQPIKAEASVMAGSNHRVDSNIDSSVGNAQGYLRVMANTSESDDYKDGNGDKVAAKWRKWNTDAALGWTPTENTWIELSGGAGDGEARYAGRGMDGSQFKRDSLGLKLEQKNISAVFKKLEAQVNYNNADHVMDNYTLRQPTAMDMGGHGHDDTMGEDHDAGMGNHTGEMNTNHAMHTDHDMAEDMDNGMGMDMSDPAMAMQLSRKTISGRVAGTFEWDRLALVTGLDANRNSHRGRMGGRHDYKNATWEEDAEFEGMGWFGEATWRMNQAHKVVTGARVDQHKVTDKRATEVSFNETRKETLPSGFVRLESQWPAQHINSYVGLGYVERMPDYWELFSPVHYGDTNAFRGVKPEKNAQLDLGLNYQFDRLRAWTSAYVGQINDYILMSYHPHEGHAGNSAGAKNVDATIAGAEAGIAYDLTDALRADINLAYAWGRNEESHKALPQIAPLDARFGLNYHQDQYSLGALWRVVAKQNRIALNQGNIVGYDIASSAGFGVFSINAAYQLDPRLNMSVGVDNLFDKNYAEHLNKAGSANFGYASNQIINDMGRNYWAKLSFKY